MRASRWVFAAALFGSFLVVSSPPAGAQLDGECSASGQWQNTDLFVDAATVGDDVITIPRKDTVSWEGSVSAPPGVHSGSIWIDLPPPFGTVEIDSWGGEGDTTSNFGDEEYDLPKFVPAGVTFKVAGEHTDENGTCTGYVNIKIKGGITDSPVFYGMAVLTIAFGAMLGMSLVPVFQAMVKSGIRRV